MKMDDINNLRELCRWLHCHPTWGQGRVRTRYGISDEEFGYHIATYYFGLREVFTPKVLARIGANVRRVYGTK